MKKNKITGCIVCGKSEIESVGLLDGRKAVRCKNCSLEWRDPFPSASQLAAFYRKSYFRQKGKFKAGYPAYDIFLDSYKEYFSRQLERLLQLHPNGGLLADVGCGPGVFLNEAKKEGFKVIGVDISEIAVKKAWQKYGIRVLQKEFDECGFENNSLDIITCFQTFEHMIEPLRFLKAVHRALNFSGTLALTTLNTNSIWKIILGRRWFSYTHLEHLYFWQERNIRIALELAGFSEIHFFSDNWRMYNVWELIALTSAYSGRKGFRFPKSHFWRILDRLRAPFPIGSIGVVAKREG